MTARFVRKTTYYRGTVYEFNLPTGSTCPFAQECKVTVDRDTGRFDVVGGSYRCYAASAERFPGVRKHRWDNFDFVRSGGVPEIPDRCRSLRIHASGDFFNQSYFDMWLDIARAHPEVEMWAYTKSIGYWVHRLGQIPENLILTASYGSRYDHLIEDHSLKNVKVYRNRSDVPDDRPINYNDDWARIPDVSFALLDNMRYSRQEVV